MKSFPRTATSYLFVCLILGLASTSVSAQQLECEPCRHGFGKVQAGDSHSFNVQLKNSGKRSLKITSDDIQGSEFSIGTFLLPMTLRPGATVELPVVFTPTAAGRVTGDITLTDTGEDPQLEIKLSGTGVDEAQHSVQLNWAPGDGTAVGYNVYRGMASGGPYAKLNSTLDPSTTYIDGTVKGGQTYYYVATEVNAEGQESGFSNIGEAVIPGS